MVCIIWRDTVNGSLMTPSMRNKEELRRIEHDTKEIEDRFYRVLVFGTGGLRSDRCGSNQMNIYTIGVATGFGQLHKNWDRR